MGRRRDSHRRPHRELTASEWMSLTYGRVEGDDFFTSDEDRHQAWLAHRHELRRNRPGTRPEAWWNYADEAEGGPMWGEYDNHEELEDARLIFLASHGLLEDEEVTTLLASPESADTVLDGLAERDRETKGAVGGR